MRLVFLLILVALPLLELAVLIRVGQIIGVAATLAIVIGTAVLGFMMLRRQGFTIVTRARQAVASGIPPVLPVAEGALVFFAGFLLILPGLIGDAIGLILLVPPVRRSIAAWSLGRFAAEGIARVRVFTGSRRDGKPQQEPARQKPGQIIEGEYTRVDETRDNPRNAND